MRLYFKYGLPRTPTNTGAKIKVNHDVKLLCQVHTQHKNIRSTYFVLQPCCLVLDVLGWQSLYKMSGVVRDSSAEQEY